MSEDHWTRPERAAQFTQCRRYVEAFKKRGFCAACIHRDADTITAFGLRVCKVGNNRIFEHCQKDGRQPKFELDVSTLAQFQQKETK